MPGFWILPAELLREHTGPWFVSQGRHGQRLTVALLSHCLYALGLSVKGSCPVGPVWALPVRAWAVPGALSLPRSTWNFPWTFTSSRGPLGLKHTLEGQFPWVLDSGFTAPLSVPQAAVHGHLDCRWCHLCSSFLLSNLPLLSGNYQRFFLEGKDTPRAQLTPTWHLLTKQISGSGPSWWSPKMAPCHSGNLE